ncbi:MAG: GTPase ObgE [Kiritimatiellae bacterium]|nr:GTPase ObgE [Kiritimatiellia bacterium]
MKAPTFIDCVQIHVRAGRGGDGVATFRREKYVPFGGPDGGDGGRGGDVVLVGDASLDSLLHLYYQPHHRAENGMPGRRKQQTGRSGEDCIVRVPCGTEVRDAADRSWIGEILRDGERLVVARGGAGGLGNLHFVTPTHQAPRECTPGRPGEERKLLLELKLISDVGLVGFPNAGKSTLLGAISRAHPRVAPYPFTTLHPCIGVVPLDEERMLRVADIPGLIAGAHRGVGLGHDFLRHIERTRFLVLLIDMAGVDGRHPADDFFSLRRELEMYGRGLDERPYLTVANKMDLPDAAHHLDEFIARTSVTPLPISAHSRQGLDVLIGELARRVAELDTAASAKSAAAPPP